MEINVQEIEMDGNTPLAINFGEGLLTQKGGWTMEEIGEDIEESPVFAKVDFENALKKASRRVKR